MRWGGGGVGRGGGARWSAERERGGWGTCPHPEYPTLTTFELLCEDKSYQKGFISDIYNILMRSTSPTQHDYMLRWSADLNVDIERETWEEIWQAASETSLCTTIKENIYKIMFGWYLTPARLNQIYPLASDQCWRGCGNRGDMAHIWWTCPEIVKYWARVQILIKEVTGLEIPIEPLTFLLAAPMPNIVRPTQEINILHSHCGEMLYCGLLEENSYASAQYNKQSLGKELLGGEEWWPLLLSTSSIPAIIQLVTLPWFPESPRYLLIDKQDERKCLKALKFFYGPQHYQNEMDDIEKECFALNSEKPKKIWELFLDRTVKWQLITIILTNVAQQLSGINAIYFYAEYVFTKAGIPAENIPYVTLGTGLCECVTALTCGLLIDNVGRRVLIIGGYALMAFWCIVLTLTLTFQEVFPWVPYVSTAAILAFILSFGLGPGGVTTALTAELFTQSARTGAYMIGGSINWLSFFTIGILFPFIVNGLDQYCFLVFFVECSLIASFIFFIVPETKNKSFLAIKEEFKKLNFGQGATNSEEDQDESIMCDAVV
ncbi:hypothetical protein FKM82_005263 [Ascaphus truei]